MKTVETLLRREIGLDAASIGSTTIERATRLRMKSLGLKKTEDYHRLLESSPAERNELVESIVVAETWFFRDCESFTAFAQLAQEWFLQNPAGPLRVLSVPCSSGEEPYSLAMCLLDVRVPPGRFVIDAFDVSKRAVTRAIRAVYGKNSFRGKQLDYRDRHFQQTKDGFTLNASVRDCVRFQQDNLLSGNFLSRHGPYHFIFCRNVLIYFDRPTQAKVLATLCSKLIPSGVLFVGPAEMPIFLDNGFVSANLPMAFACHRRGQAVASPSRADAAMLRASRASVVAGKTQSRAALYREREAVVPEFSTSATGVSVRLETARELANAGKLKEAAELCEWHLRHEGPSAQAYYLLGLVFDAGGDPQAADYYRKALYLEPDHYETLWHMALLMEKNGEDGEARAFKRRAERAQENAQVSRL